MEIRGQWRPWNILIWIAATEIRGRWCPWEILIWISYGDPRAMVPMEYPYLDSGLAMEIRGRWCPWEIQIWIAATENRERWSQWGIFFTTDYGLDPMQKLV